MNQPSELHSAAIPRRSVLAFALIGLTGCGGGAGGGGFMAGPPGTVGTGLFAQGAITGFGSVIVNAIRFDDTTAAVQIDGQPATSADLRLGMVVDVQGQRGTDLTLGVASQIEVWSIAQGDVSQVQSGQFTVAGMRVQTSASTVFDGISSAALLADGMRVAVWGLQSGADGSRWMATRVALVSAPALVSTGIVTAAGSLNGIAMTGPKASSLVVGQLVRAQCVWTSSGSWQVDSVKQQGLQNVASSHEGDFEIEGMVTALLSSGHFMLGSTEVDASSASMASSLASLSVGQRIEVYGTWAGTVLKASKMELEAERTLDEADIEARIEQFTSLSNFVVRGQRCDASAATISKGTVSGLKVGVKVKLTGTKAGDVLRVSTLEIDD